MNDIVEYARTMMLCTLRMLEVHDKVVQFRETGGFSQSEVAELMIKVEEIREEIDGLVIDFDMDGDELQKLQEKMVDIKQQMHSLQVTLATLID